MDQVEVGKYVLFSLTIHDVGIIGVGRINGYNRIVGWITVETDGREILMRPHEIALVFNTEEEAYEKEDSL